MGIITKINSLAEQEFKKGNFFKNLYLGPDNYAELQTDFGDVDNDISILKRIWKVNIILTEKIGELRIE